MIPLMIRKKLGRKFWSIPEPFGPAGWRFDHLGDEPSSIIVSVCEWDDGIEWIHASISMRTRMPQYSDLQHLHHAVFGDGYAYQVFAPARDHVNIHQHALHLWGRADGQPALPDFGRFGTI